MLFDEIIGSATFEGKEPATKAHGWIDNNEKNEWDVWTTYIQDKENTIWVAKLKIANTTNGEKVLYDVHPIGKVGQGRTLPTIPTDDKILHDTPESQEKLSDREIAGISNNDYAKMYNHFGSTKNYDVAGYRCDNSIIN